jgi:hypothetical protein
MLGAKPPTKTTRFILMPPEIVALSKALSEQRFEVGKQVRGLSTYR